MSIRYQIRGTSEVLLLSNEVLTHFLKHQQLRCLSREAGGQLFARFEKDLTIVEEVSGPRPTDIRRMFTYKPDRAAEQKEIYINHSRGLHYLGDWHTHPEHIPFPSQQDLQSVEDCFRRSIHSLSAFLLIIVGRAPFPKGLHVSLIGDRGVQVLSPIL